MSRDIDPDRIAAGDLTYAEAQYLQDRMQLPADYEMPDSDVRPRKETVPGTQFTPLEQQSVPTMKNAGGIVEDDYLEGWNNESRRAELSKRGLSLEGNKDDLIARLRRSDTNQLTDEDYTELS